MTINIAVLMTCHNRITKTKKCLEKISLLKKVHKIRLNIYLVDDGSRDGTGVYIKKKFPKIKLLKGNGNLFWAGGMRIAWNKAKKKQYDYYLWLNDDVFLYNDFLGSCFKDIQVVKKQEQKKKFIISYPTFCNIYKRQSTGGKNLIENFFTYKFISVKKSKKLIKSDSFNGNCVLISNEAFKNVGNLDKNFSHRFADFDYGLMAKKKGITNYLSNKYSGICNIDINKIYKNDDYKEWVYFLRKNSKFWLIHSVKFLAGRVLKVLK